MNKTDLITFLDQFEDDEDIEIKVGKLQPDGSFVISTKHNSKEDKEMKDEFAEVFQKIDRLRKRIDELDEALKDICFSL